MLRSIYLTMLLLPMLPLAVVAPFAGVLVWVWISVMNPHVLVAGFLSGFPLLDFVAGATILGWLFSRERKAPPGEAVVVLLGMFFVWICITTLASQNIELSMSEKWPKIAKGMLFVYMMLCLTSTKERLIVMIAVLAMSLGYWSIWGGMGTIKSAGAFSMQGPQGTMLADRNHLAMGMALGAPLIFWLGTLIERWYLRWAVFAAGALSLLAVVGTQSRGGMVCLVAMATWLVVRSRRRFIYGPLFALIASVGVGLLAQAWRDRMASISAFSEDGSALGRLQMWRYALELAKEHPITGGGLAVYHNRPLAEALLPDGLYLRASHSIYFEVLGEQGYIGLFLYLSLMACGILTCWRIRSLTRNKPDLGWARNLAFGLEMSMVAFAVGGAFLEVAYIDVYFYLLALIAITHALVKQALGVTTERAKIGSRPAPPMAVPGLKPAE